jgi:arylsulfatase A-like enzyme
MPARRDGELERLPSHFKRMAGEPMLVSGRRNPTRMPDAHLREIIAHTYGMISCVDAHLGRVLDALEASPFARDTVVVFLCDHGDLMGDHWLINKGPFHFEGMVRAPFLWRWPGVFAQNLETPALASLLDFAPTILDLAAVPIPEGPAPAEPEAPQNLPPWPGVSLAPLLRGETDRLHESLVIENDEDYLGLRLRTLITPDYQITVYGGQEYGELFDLREDPQQLRNRWASPAHRARRDELSNRLLHELIESDSALPRRLSHA